MDAVAVFTEIKNAVESIKNDEAQCFPEAASTGDYWRQGDIYITKLRHDSLDVNVSKAHPNQLAPGNTQGSRHVATGDCSVYSRSGDALTGPVVKVNSEAVITHPEHGDLKLPPGVFGITYQRAYAEELKRVLD